MNQPHPIIGIPANEVTKTVSEDAAPNTPHTQLAQKKTLETGFGEQQKLIPARPVVHTIFVQIAALPIIETLFVIPAVIPLADSAKASAAVGSKSIIL